MLRTIAALLTLSFVLAAPAHASHNDRPLRQPVATPPISKVLASIKRRVDRDAKSMFDRHDSHITRYASCHAEKMSVVCVGRITAMNDTWGRVGCSTPYEATYDDLGAIRVHPLSRHPCGFYDAVTDVTTD